MLNAFAAIAVGTALLNPTHVVNVTSVGDDGWDRAGAGTYSITMDRDSVNFDATVGEKVDMKLRKVGTVQLSTLATTPVIQGENAHLVFEGYLNGKFTSVVFNTATPGTVHLTWGSAPDQYLPEAEFQSKVATGALTGFFYSTLVGHTNTADTNGEHASVDYVEYGGTRYDFGLIPGADLTDPEINRPGVGNSNGLGNGHGQGHANGHANGQGVTNGKGHAKK